MEYSKNRILNIIDTLILFFLALHVVTSQLNIVSSSIGLGGLIILVIFRLILNRDLYKPDKYLIYFFILLVLAYLLSSVFSIEPASSFSNSRRVLLFTGFFAAIIFIKDLRQLKIMLICLFVFSALVSIYEIVLFWNDIYDSQAPAGRLQRINYFGYPITNGEIKMLVLLLLVSLILIKEKFVLSRLWLILLSVPVLLSLYLTYSRNAILGLFAGLLVIGFARNKYFLAGFIIILVLFLLFAPMAVKGRLLSIVDFNHPTIESRFIMWETGVKIIKDNPLLGIGDTDIKPVYAKYKKIELHGEGSHLHNNFLQILASIGIIGFVSWCLTMIYIFYRQLKIYVLTKKNEVLSSLVIASIASMVAFQISGLTEWNFGDFEFAAVLWFMLGLAFLSQKLHKQSTAL
jgi:O-antigen ligase